MHDSVQKRFCLRVLLLALLLAPMTATVGCGDDPKDPSDGVENNDTNNDQNNDQNNDTNNDQNNDQNNDTPDCEDDDDCADGQVCNDAGVCEDDDVNNDTPECEDDNDCPGNEVCNDGGECVPGDDGPDVEVVECGTLEPAQEGTCDVAPGNDNIVIRGAVLAPEQVFAGGEVLVGADGNIACVGCDCSDNPAYDGATVVTCADGVISPGLINTHDHITFTQNSPADWGTERFDHRHDWRRGLRGHSRIGAGGGASGQEVLWGELRQLVGGTTSLAGSGSAGGFLRNLDRGNDHEGLGQEAIEMDTFPLGDTGGQLRAQGCDYPDLPSPGVLNEDAWVPHVSEGIDNEARNEFLCISSEADGGVDVTEDNGAFIHAVGVIPVDGRELAANGTSVIWSPRSNISLYGHTAPVTMLDAQGVLLALGTDWTPSGSINMLRELACADSLNTQHYNGYFSDKQIWEMATTNAATAMAVDDGVGLLREGLLADIAVYASQGSASPYRAVIDGNMDTTVLVMRGGDPLFGDSDIMAELPGGTQGCETMPEDCGTPKDICVQKELGTDFSALVSANRGSYDLFFCGVPAGEPTCVPSRPDEFSGEVTDDDLDGDGIANELDNCPDVFNPARPVDGNVQGDFDGDGAGDVCDPCPVDPDTDVCSTPDPADQDADGVLNVDDNCPRDPNPDQNDGDSDGKGDVCDACPDDFNPGQAGCPVSIYDIKTGGVEVGERVVVEGVVTAVAGNSFFIQVPDAAQDDAQGAEFSGIFTFIPGANPDNVAIPSVGNLVRYGATISEFFGQIQLSFVVDMEVLEADSPLPTPVDAAPADAATDGPRAAALESVLATVRCEVVELNPAAGPGDSDPTNEYVCNGGLRVNDLMHATEPFPQVDDVLEVTGVIRFANADSKLEPRDADDVTYLVAAPPTLAAFGPERVFVELSDGPIDTAPELTLTLDRPAPEGGTEIQLASDAPGVVSVAATVTVPEGEREVTLQVTGETAGEATITATLEGESLDVTVVALDADRVPVPVGIEPEGVLITLGNSAELTVRLDVPAVEGGTEVQLSAAPDGLVTLPGSVTVEAGQVTATFAVTGDAAGAVTLTASAGGTDVSANAEVVETPPLGLIISEVFYDAEGGDDGKEWVEIYNGTNQTIDLSGYALGYGGRTYDNGTYQLSGTIEPGGCFVVGGTQSGADNGNPTFDQPQDFNPDMQNSGNDADAVGLFNLTADQINAGSVPIDNVLYGGANAHGFVDPEGNEAAVDVADAGANTSIERTTDGWRIQEAPTPNDCTVLF